MKPATPNYYHLLLLDRHVFDMMKLFLGYYTCHYVLPLFLILSTTHLVQ